MTCLPLALDTGSMDFAALRREGCYYVDKTMHLRGLLGPSRAPLLLTRPRRFGKTITQTTLRSFLELSYEHPGAANGDAELFADLAISRDRALCTAYQSQYPVIFMTLKDVQYRTFEAAYNKLCQKVAELFDSFAFLAEAPQLSSLQRRAFAGCLTLAEPDERPAHRQQLLTSSLLLLARCLYAVYRRPAYILIDEYDVPLQKAAASSTAQDRSYFIDMLDLISGMLGEVLKTTEPCIKRCILSGCLRLNAPGRHSGLNNLQVLSVDSLECAELMGFTEAEVEALLAACGLKSCAGEARAWYNGYQFGTSCLYNPWSLINYCHTCMISPQTPAQNFWIETSSNDFRRYFIGELSAKSIAILQRLMDGEVIELRLRKALSYPDLDKLAYDDRDFFTILYHEGYLTRAGGAAQLSDRLRIPNCEVLDCFREKISDYFAAHANAANPRLRDLITAFLSADRLGVQRELNWLYWHYLDVRAAAGRLRRTRELRATPPVEELGSCRPDRELGYQVLTQGVLAPFDNTALADLTAEHKLGTGMVDLSFMSGSHEALACLVEFKIARGESDQALSDAAELGLRQTREQGCASALFDRYPRLQCIYSYGIGCRRKKCRVAVEVIERPG